MRAHQIVATEKGYFESLSLLVDVYLKGMEDFLGTDVCKYLFPRVLQRIKDHSARLIRSFEAALSKARDSEELRFGQIFRFIIPSLSIYGEYVSAMASSLRVYGALHANRAFNVEFQRLRHALGRGRKESLSMFLIMPVQRVPRYELLLKDLAACTLPSMKDW